MGCAGIAMTLLPAGYRPASMPEDRGAIERGRPRRESGGIGVFECPEIRERESIPRWPGFPRIRAFSSARTLEGRRTDFLEPGFLEPGFLEPGFLERRAAR